MTDYTYKIEPGDQVTLSEYSQNLLDLQSSTTDIKKDQILPGSIGLRHTNGNWKLTKTWSDYSTTKNQTQATSTPVHVGGDTTVGLGNPVFVFASFEFIAVGGNSVCDQGIYVDNVRKAVTRLHVDAGHTQEAYMFFMFQSTADIHKIELKTDVTNTQQNYSIQHFEIEIFSVRT